MIEINLHPDRERRKKKEAGPGLFDRLEFRVPDWMRPGEIRADPWTTALIAAVALAALAVGGSWLLLEDREEDLERRVERAVQDSARLADLVVLTDSLREYRSELAERAERVKELDRSRYVWSHLLDELSRALPETAWLTGVTRNSPLPELTVDVQGVASDPLSITSYVRGLEDSPYVREVEIETSERRAVDDGLRAHAFTLRVRYRRPPDSVRRTVPLAVGEGG